MNTKEAGSLRPAQKRRCGSPTVASCVASCQHMRNHATQDHKNCSLSSQDSGQTELKLSEFAMKLIEFSRISQNSLVMECRPGMACGTMLLDLFYCK